MILDVDSRGRPPLVVLGEGNQQVLVRPGVLAVVTTLKVDAGAPNRGMMKFIPHPRLDGGDGEEIQEEIENRGNAEKAFSQGDEGREMLDPIQI